MGPYKGQRCNETDGYKAIEGASYLLAVHRDPELENAIDTIITKIAAAQEPDGYLFTARTADPAPFLEVNGRPVRCVLT